MIDKKQILVVEDEPHLAVGIKFNLEAEGYQVTVVGDGPMAKELRKRAAEVAGQVEKYVHELRKELEGSAAQPAKKPARRKVRRKPA